MTITCYVPVICNIRVRHVLGRASPFHYWFAYCTELENVKNGGTWQILKRQLSEILNIFSSTMCLFKGSKTSKKPLFNE